MEKLLENEPWIKTEEPFFGKPGTIYDFKDLELLTLTEEIKKMIDEKDELKSRVNPSVEELAKKN